MILALKGFGKMKVRFAEPSNICNMRELPLLAILKRLVSIHPVSFLMVLVGACDERILPLFLNQKMPPVIPGSRNINKGSFSPNKIPASS